MKEDTGSTRPSAITPLLTGQVRDLFFMRDAGYIVIGRHDDEAALADRCATVVDWQARRL
jgi:hypothetical protein